MRFMTWRALYVRPHGQGDRARGGQEIQRRRTRGRRCIIGSKIRRRCSR
jgi:hypothetical protein